MTKTEFDTICDQFTNKSIFEREGRNFKRDIDGSLVMKQKYIDLRRNPIPSWR